MTEPRTLDVVTVGESLGLLSCEEPGALRHGSRMRLTFGGAESNVAIGVARLGGAAGWIGRLGADAVGALILRELRAESVRTYATIDPVAATAIMLKELPVPGSSRVRYYRQTQAGSRLTADDVPQGAVASAKILHVTGISAALGTGPLSALHRAIDDAKDSGTLVSFDVNHRGSLWADAELAAKAYRALARRADIVFAGDDEAVLLTESRDLRAQLDTLLEWGADQAVVKRGQRGAVVATREGGYDSMPAVEVPVIDTVGAGDAFVAGWLAEQARGAALRVRLATAVACGALACTARGDWEANPTRADLAQLQRSPADPVSR